MTSAALGVAGAVPLAVVDRNGFPESVHQGAAVVVDADGRVVAARGDVDGLVYPRSALKPFQTVAAVRAGARLDEEALVIVTASHAGSPMHLAAVRRVLGAHGLDESALRTPEAWPLSAGEARALAASGSGPSRIAMNCSGNHAGMLAGACAAGWDTDDYLAASHPVHALAEEVLGELAGTAPSHPGTDGCGGPVWAVPLAALARGYGRLVATEPALAAAVRARPDLVDGLGGATTRAIEGTGVFAKSGAEGVWCAVAPDGAAAAVKVLDGSGRAAAAIVLALLAHAGSLDPDAVEAYLAHPSLTVTGGGTEVGRLRVLTGGSTARPATTSPTGRGPTRRHQGSFFPRPSAVRTQVGVAGKHTRRSGLKVLGALEGLESWPTVYRKCVRGLVRLTARAETEKG